MSELRSAMEKRAFVMSDGQEWENLYHLYLERAGYKVKCLQKYGFTGITWRYSEKLLQDVIDFQPHLIICDVDSYYYPTGYDYIFGFLQKIRDGLEADKKPMYLILGSIYAHMPYLSTHKLTDKFLPIPCEAKTWREAVKDLELKMFV